MIENDSGAPLAVDNSNEVAEVQVVEQLLDAEEPKTETAESVEKQENNTDGEVKRKRPSGFHRKINRLEQENAQLAAKLAKLETPQVTNEKPIIDNFATYDEYTEALTDWKVEQKLVNRDKEARNIEIEKQKAKEQQTWQEKIDSLSDDYEDYEEVVGSAFNNVQLDQAVIDAAKEAGPEVIYKMAQNKELAAKIAKMSAVQAIKEIVRLESELSTPTVKISKSSEPIKPGRGTAKTTVKLESLDTDSYIMQQHPHLFGKK